MVSNLGLKDAFALLAVIWVVSSIDFVLPSPGLAVLSIAPRSVMGLLGVPFSAFLHGSVFHLLSNSIPLLVLTMLLAISEGRAKLWKIIILGILGAGIITWLFSTGGRVVGASGLVFALIGYLSADCVFLPCKKSIPIGLITLFVFGGSVFSLYHFAPHIAFSAHFGGLVTGIVLAKWMGGKSKRIHN